MAKDIDTFEVALSPGVESSEADIAIPAPAVSEPEAAALAVPASVEYPLGPSRAATASLEFPDAVPSRDIDLLSGVVKKIASKDVAFIAATLIKTKPLKVDLPRVSEKTHSIPCVPPDGIKTFPSPYLDNAPQSREMLNMKRIPFPVLSEFMSELAKKNGTAYTNIVFIGAFDPVPTHLAEKLTLDTVMGVLKFYVRKEPRGERRFARVVYGRRRDNHEIISALFPVT
ncbi:MAG TPA: hypothetical protein PLK80_08660 [bacterium]|nr:hypothetical protein [bacterium]HPI76795.1 hypothetical protein [bacterium]HPN95346.1 hypothetical protein [bacterium]